MKYLLVFFLFISEMAISQTRTINVTGTAKGKVKPDITVIELSVSKQDSVEATVMNKLNDEVQNLSRVIEASGIDRTHIKISKYTVNETYDYQNNNKSIYNASNSLKLQLRTDEVFINQLLSSIQSQKLNDLDISFNYLLSDSLEKAIRSNLVKQAITEAKLTAENIAKTSSIQLKNIYQITRKNYDEPVKIPLNLTYTLTFANQPTPRNSSSFEKYNIEDVELTEQVDVTYEIKNY